MKLIKPNFITMADEKFVGPLRISISQALRFYPDSHFYVYDVGLSEKSKTDLLKNFPNLRIEQWTLQYLPVQLAYNRSFVKMKGLGLLVDYFENLFGKNDFPRLRSLIKQSHIEIFFQNKLAIIKHHNDCVQSPFIFLDADAFLIDKIDELFDGSFDLGVTLRRKEEQDDSFNNCRLLNVGVMLFLGEYATNKTLIDSWYHTARITNEQYSEQTSLTRLLLDKCPTIFNKLNVTNKLLFTDNREVRVKVLDCNTYNFSWIEELNSRTELNGIKILHFKNERFKTPLFAKIANWLGISINP